MESYFLLIFKYRYNNLIVGQSIELTMNINTSFQQYTALTQMRENKAGLFEIISLQHLH